MVKILETILGFWNILDLLSFYDRLKWSVSDISRSLSGGCDAVTAQLLDEGFQGLAFVRCCDAFGSFVELAGRTAPCALESCFGAQMDKHWAALGATQKDKTFGEAVQADQRLTGTLGLEAKHDWMLKRCCR